MPSIPTGLMPLAILGRHLFILDNASLSSLKKTWQFNIASIDRVGQNPKKQYLGESERKITLPGTIYPGLYGRIKFIDEIVKDANEGSPMLLITNYKGIGDVLGFWFVESCDEAATAFDPQNFARKLDFTITLTYYGETYEGDNSYDKLRGFTQPYMHRILRQL